MFSGAPKVMASLSEIFLSSSDHPNKYPLLPARMFTICPNCGLDLGSGFLYMLYKLGIEISNYIICYMQVVKRYQLISMS